MQPLFRFLLTAALFVTWKQGHALACGETLVANTTLTMNYNCRGLPFAFKLARSGIVLNLNGKTISGGDLDGLLADGVRDVQIRGPGSLQVSRNAIRATNTDRLLVSGVTIVGGGPNGIVLVNSRGAKIESCRIDGLNGKAIDIYQPLRTVSAGAGGHTIRANTISNVHTGIRICGADAGDNDILGNTFVTTGFTSIDISHDANRNWIASNRFRQVTSVLLNTSSENLFAGNVFEPRARGISVLANPPTECITRATWARSADNQFLNNEWYDVKYPMMLGSGHPDGQIINNRIGHNRIQGAVMGIVLHTNTYYNDATGNVFVDTGIPVVNDGVGNTY